MPSFFSILGGSNEVFGFLWCFHLHHLQVNCQFKFHLLVLLNNLYPDLCRNSGGNIISGYRKQPLEMRSVNMLLNFLKTLWDGREMWPGESGVAREERDYGQWGFLGF